MKTFSIKKKKKKSMYENNFWYLFDVKNQTSLNYDNLKKYYVNLEGFLKPDDEYRKMSRPDTTYQNMS